MSRKSKGAEEGNEMRETKRKIVSVKSQKEKPVEEKEVKILKEEELLQESGTDSDYDADSLSGSLNSDDFDSDIFDSEDDASPRETEDGESSEDGLHGHEGSEDGDESEQVDSDNGEEEDGSDEDSEQGEAVEESDSSEDEVAPRNTVGDVPLEWYKDEKHIGYDITGKKITKKEKLDKLDSFLATMDDSKNWRKIIDDYNDEEVELTKEESKIIRRMLETGLKEISSMAIHPSGDHLIVGSKDGKLCWFDMDLSSKPYKTLKNHPKDITNVAFHRSYPLFASCSEDSTAYVFHGMVYNDLNQNPLIVPLEILRGHSNGGVLDCKFHPRQPWLFTAGADSIIKLYCH